MGPFVFGGGKARGSGLAQLSVEEDEKSDEQPHGCKKSTAVRRRAVNHLRPFYKTESRLTGSATTRRPVHQKNGNGGRSGTEVENDINPGTWQINSQSLRTNK
jgi:hypothetical protein